MKYAKCTFVPLFFPSSLLSLYFLSSPRLIPSGLFHHISLSLTSAHQVSPPLMFLVLSLCVWSALSLYSSSCQSISLNNSLINGLIIILTVSASSSLSLSIPLSISLTDIVIHLINGEIKCQIFLLPVFPSPFLSLPSLFSLSLLSHTSTHLPFFVFLSRY